MHLFTERFGDTLSNNNFVEATKQLIYSLTVTSFYSHRSGISTRTGFFLSARKNDPFTPSRRNITAHIGIGAACTPLVYTLDRDCANRGEG